MPHSNAENSAGNRTAHIPLGKVANLKLMPGPNLVSRENGKRRIVVSANVRGRDIGSFVPEVEQQIQQQVKISAGYWTTWGGTFEQLHFVPKAIATGAEAQRPLATVVIGGILSSTMLTLLVLPLLYRLAHGKDEEVEDFTTTTDPKPQRP